MGYFQIRPKYSVICCGGDNKAAALNPGAAHDHRAATERFPESTDEIGSAARRGGRCGWRPSMMNEAGSVHHRCRCFLLSLCGEPRYKFEKIYGSAILWDGPHFIDALKLVAKVVFCEAFQSSRRKYRGTGMYKTVSKPLAHLNFLSGVNCYDISSISNKV